MTPMKIILSIVILLATLSTFGQSMSLQDWNEEAKTNIRLLPKYGHVPKSDGQKSADKEFIETALKQIPSSRKASDHMVELGFKYLYKDIKTAMYRFNQAYLLDSTNTDIYWGYGGVYSLLGDLENAQKQYLEGLTINPQNTHILTDYGTYFMSQFYAIQPVDNKIASTLLDTAISYLTKSYQIDSKDPNTTFKLSVCYFQKGDCKNAWKYYDECQAVGGQPISDDYTNDLKRKCKENK